MILLLVAIILIICVVTGRMSPVGALVAFLVIWLLLILVGMASVGVPRLHE